MRYRYFMLFFSVLLTVAACADPAEQEVDPLVGVWTVERVTEDSLDITNRLDPVDDQFFRFQDDGSFYSDGTAYGRKGGEWMMQADTLYLESDPVGVGEDSFWIVQLQGDSMRWLGWHSAVTERYTMTLKRK